MDGWIKEAVKAKGRTVTDLAKMLDIDLSVASRVATGKRPLRIAEAETVAAFLDIPLAEVMARAGLHSIGGTVSVVATIDAAGAVVDCEPVVLGKRQFDAITALVGGRPVAVAEICAMGAALDTMLVAYEPRLDVRPDCAGRLCIVETEQGRALAKIVETYRSGATALSVFGGATLTARVLTASPVVAMVP